MDTESLIDKLSDAVPTDEDVYLGENGLLYCRRCNTARQTVVSISGSKRIVKCICKCMADEHERSDEERKKQELMQRINRNRNAGFPDREMMQYRFEADDGSMPEITAAMKRYVEHFDDFRKKGKGLLLYGNVGTGKSFMAACVVNALIDLGYPCLMTNFSRLTNQLSGMWEGKQEYIDGICRYALVAIDDLGVERDTEFMNENVTTIIDEMVRAKVPMIITSNYTPKQLTESCDIRKRRIYDRITSYCFPVKIDGQSRRKTKAREEYGEMKDILGL